MIMKKFWIALLAIVAVETGVAQPTFPVNGTPENNQNYYAFTNATIFVDYETRLEQATLIVQNGKVLEVGTDINPPKGSVVYDLEGKFIYPSFIDLYSSYGMPKVKETEWKPQPQMNSNKKGAYHWNQSIKSEVRAAEMFKVDRKTAKAMVNIGFGAVLTHQQDGIARGTSVLTTLGDGKEHDVILMPDAAAQYSFSGGSSRQDYPSSLMGSIALLRQTYYDAQWHQQAKQEQNLSLDAFNANQALPQIFEVSDKLSALRADKIGDEFDVQYIIKGRGDEYQRIDAVKATGATYIIPLNFPKAYDVKDAYDAMLVTLGSMRHWEMAPGNAAALANNEIPFALTSSNLKDKGTFWGNLRKAVRHGLSEIDALKALTYTPAQLLGMEENIGGLNKGMVANFIVTSENIFNSKSTIFENWIQGKRHVINATEVLDVRGKYDLNINNVIYEMTVKGGVKKPSGSIQVIRNKTEQDTVYNNNLETGLIDTTYTDVEKPDTVDAKVTVKHDGHLISISFEPNDVHYKGIVRLSGNINYRSGIWDGMGQLPDGEWLKWSAIRKKEHDEKKKGKKGEDTTPVDSMVVHYPNIAYGYSEAPEAAAVLIENATVWTNEAEGILKNTSVLLRNGKIEQIGTNIELRDGEEVLVVDGRGKHVTAGIIDEHSHIAISGGVNESGQASSAEVSISDVVNSDDVNIYRQLAGGVTACQLLHGSANPIGGQSALIKLRWGRTPEEMKIKDTDGFIKFALGENVKQANWGDYNTVRFPQTRMGVEQVFYDGFIRAKEYKAKWENYNKLTAREKANTLAPRKDLELEALGEILDKKRFISCHSYVQSEINMLMHVADSMGFTLNTFTHILEGYKLADKMKEHGAGGSTFSDWWAYKYEVNDAIPYNGALMHEQGVVVAYNSDDAEMARRLNQEAAKAVKYGGVPEEEALKFVTLNPAKLLHLDDRMGSIKVGKDADVVVWSDHPLSVSAKAEKTFVDGICYYDSVRDEQMREEMAKERARLIAKMLGASANGAPTQRPKRQHHKLYHCDTIGE